MTGLIYFKACGMVTREVNDCVRFQTPIADRDCCGLPA
jgi:hypothetical protein